MSGEMTHEGWAADCLEVDRAVRDLAQTGGIYGVRPISSGALRVAVFQASALREQCAVLASSRSTALHGWLGVVVAGGVVEMDAAAFGRMAYAVTMASGDLPIAAFDAALADALRRIDRVSSRAVDDVVRPVAVEMRLRLRALDRILKAGTGSVGKKHSPVVTALASSRAAADENDAGVSCQFDQPVKRDGSGTWE